MINSHRSKNLSSFSQNINKKRFSAVNLESSINNYQKNAKNMKANQINDNNHDKNSFIIKRSRNSSYNITSTLNNPDSYQRGAGKKVNPNNKTIEKNRNSGANNQPNQKSQRLFSSQSTKKQVPRVEIFLDSHLNQAINKIKQQRQQLEEQKCCYQPNNTFNVQDKNAIKRQTIENQSQSLKQCEQTEQSFKLSSNKKNRKNYHEYLENNLAQPTLIQNDIVMTYILNVYKKYDIKNPLQQQDTSIQQFNLQTQYSQGQQSIQKNNQNSQNQLKFLTFQQYPSFSEIKNQNNNSKINKKETFNINNRDDLNKLQMSHNMKIQQDSLRKNSSKKVKNKILQLKNKLVKSNQNQDQQISPQKSIQPRQQLFPNKLETLQYKRHKKSFSNQLKNYDSQIQRISPHYHLHNQQNGYFQNQRDLQCFKYNQEESYNDESNHYKHQDDSTTLIRSYDIDLQRQYFQNSIKNSRYQNNVYPITFNSDKNYQQSSPQRSLKHINRFNQQQKQVIFTQKNKNNFNKPIYDSYINSRNLKASNYQERNPKSHQRNPLYKPSKHPNIYFSQKNKQIYQNSNHDVLNIDGTFEIGNIDQINHDQKSSKYRAEKNNQLRSMQNNYGVQSIKPKRKLFVKTNNNKSRAISTISITKSNTNLFQQSSTLQNTPQNDKNTIFLNQNYINSQTALQSNRIGNSTNKFELSAIKSNCKNEYQLNEQQYFKFNKSNPKNQRVLQPISQTYRYCLGCQQPILEANIPYHQANQCYKIKQLYQIKDLKELQSIVDKKITKIKQELLNEQQQTQKINKQHEIQCNSSNKHGFLNINNTHINQLQNQLRNWVQKSGRIQDKQQDRVNSSVKINSQRSSQKQYLKIQTLMNNSILKTCQNIKKLHWFLKIKQNIQIQQIQNMRK